MHYNSCTRGSDITELVYIQWGQSLGLEPCRHNSFLIMKVFLRELSTLLIFYPRK